MLLPAEPCAAAPPPWGANTALPPTHVSSPPCICITFAAPCLVIHLSPFCLPPTLTQVYFVAPSVVRMKDDIKQMLTARGIPWAEVDDLKEVGGWCGWGGCQLVGWLSVCSVGWLVGRVLWLGCAVCVRRGGALGCCPVLMGMGSASEGARGAVPARLCQLSPRACLGRSPPGRL